MESKKSPRQKSIVNIYKDNGQVQRQKDYDLLMDKILRKKHTELGGYH